MNPTLEVILFLVLPVVLLYTGLVLFSTSRDRWRP
ncbi:hypothetical protein DFQ13_116115 [Actinokineospora spheciospongiae]|nr:hypothetical protein DFQ13_116115 [Actinokineospora spheciospongiae]